MRLAVCGFLLGLAACGPAESTFNSAPDGQSTSSEHPTRTESTQFQPPDEFLAGCVSSNRWFNRGSIITPTDFVAAFSAVPNAEVRWEANNQQQDAFILRQVVQDRLTHAQRENAILFRTLDASEIGWNQSDADLQEYCGPQFVTLERVLLNGEELTTGSQYSRFLRDVASATGKLQMIQERMSSPISSPPSQAELPLPREDDPSPLSNGM